MYFNSFYSDSQECTHICMYSGASIIQPPIGQVFLAAIMWKLEYVTSIKWRTPFWCKMALLLKVYNYKFVIINTLSRSTVVLLS